MLVYIITLYYACISFTSVMDLHNVGLYIIGNGMWVFVYYNISCAATSIICEFWIMSWHRKTMSLCVFRLRLLVCFCLKTDICIHLSRPSLLQITSSSVLSSCLRSFWRRMNQYRLQADIRHRWKKMLLKDGIRQDCLVVRMNDNWCVGIDLLKDRALSGGLEELGTIIYSSLSFLPNFFSSASLVSVYFTLSLYISLSLSVALCYRIIFVFLHIHCIYLPISICM